jgi:hypothetical protein
MGEGSALGAIFREDGIEVQRFIGGLEALPLTGSVLGLRILELVRHLRIENCRHAGRSSILYASPVAKMENSA